MYFKASKKKLYAISALILSTLFITSVFALILGIIDAQDIKIAVNNDESYIVIIYVFGYLTTFFLPIFSMIFSLNHSVKQNASIKSVSVGATLHVALSDTIEVGRNIHSYQTLRETSMYLTRGG
jgi:hypothetical protein